MFKKYWLYIKIIGAAIIPALLYLMGRRSARKDAEIKDLNEDVYLKNKTIQSLETKEREREKVNDPNYDRTANRNKWVRK